MAKIATNKPAYQVGENITYEITGPPNQQIRWTSTINGQPSGEDNAFYNQFTDAGAKELAKLPKLQTLNISWNSIGDDALKHLSASKSLRSLNVQRTSITDAGLKHLATVEQLQDLDLSLNKLTAAGIKELGGLKNLEKLNLNFIKLGDAGLKELAGFKKLRWLSVVDAAASEMALASAAKVAESSAFFASGRSSVQTATSLLNVVAFQFGWIAIAVTLTRVPVPSSLRVPVRTWTWPAVTKSLQCAAVTTWLGPRRVPPQNCRS